jgi:CheY-like chemotaxis protein
MKRVLIIDDDCLNEQESIQEAFAGTGIETFLCPTREEGMKLINSKALFDCIVLDWYLDNESSNLSQLILKELEKVYYTPVLIYSNHATNFREEKDAGIVTYPENLICEVDKSDFKDISTKVTEWLNANTTAKLSSIYLAKVYEKIHQAFWDLNEIPHGNIASVYKHISSENGNIDWANDFIVNLLLQNLVSDEDFRTQISELIEQIQNPETNPEEKKKILNKILYFKSNSPYISNGDIFRIEIGETISYGIVTSPDCDLFQNKTKYVDFVELREIRDDLGNGSLRGQIEKNKSESHFLFLSLELENNTFTDLAAILKSKNRIVCCNKDAEKYPCVTNRIKYADSLQIDNTDCTLTYICSLLNPYKSEFAQRKSSHDSRVGIPPVYEYYTTNQPKQKQAI